MAPLPPRASPTIEAILAAYEAEAGDDFREHLGASLIGRECDRALWYEFRWVTRTAQGGRMLRLFETGRLEEERLIRNLRRIGVIVLDVDPETGRQWHVQAHGGQFGGSLDGVGLGVPEAPKTWHVLEFKTHNAKSFAELRKHGVRRAKPEHWAQMQVYMHLTGLTRALYLAVCKDTDALYAERVRVDHDEAERLLARAGRIIFAQHPPARISDDPDWFQCRLCPHHDTCHGNRLPERTCRSCLHVTPTEDGGWHCARFDRRLSADEQRAGCPSHLFIPDLIHGEQFRCRSRWHLGRLPQAGRQRLAGQCGMTLQLRPYQRAAIDAIYDYFAAATGHPLLVLPTASGKSLVMAAFIQEVLSQWPDERILILAHVRELISQNFAELLRLWPEAPAGIYSAGLNRRDVQAQILFAGIQSVHRKAYAIQRADLVLVDECFTPGTPVRVIDTGEVVERPIERIVPGDLVQHALGQGLVEAIRRSTADRLVTLELSNGSAVRCTPNHQFFTDQGWVEAAALEIGQGLYCAEDVHALWSDVSAAQANEGASLEQAAILFNILLEEGGEPDVGARRKGEDGSKAEGNRASAEGSIWQRPRAHRAAAGASDKARRGLGSRVSGSDGEAEGRRVPHRLQDRHCTPAADDCHRARRVFSLRQEAGGRSKEGCSSDRVRVVRVSHQECGREQVVFNLRVGGHPSFYAGGVLVHNCHLIPRSANTTYRRFLDDLSRINPQLKIIGLTATPYRLDSGMLHTGPEALFDDIAFEVSVRELIDQGYLAPLISKQTSTQLDVSGVGTRGGEFIAGQLEAAVDQDPITQAAIDEVVAYGRERRSWLLFCAGVDHAGHVCDAVRGRGFSCATIFGHTPKADRDRIITAFKRGEIRALASMGVLTTGFNAPAVDLIAMLRPTKSAGLYVQMAGRGTRLAPGKDNCLVLDFAGNVARHGPIDLVKPKDKANGQGDGEGPTKVCPACQTINALAARVCIECDYAFPSLNAAQLEPTATTRPILSTGRPEWIDVGAVTYYRHEKPGKPPSLRVDYHCGLVRHREWVCLQHAGYPGRKAAQWWQRRAKSELPPSTVDEALARIEELRQPIQIAVRPNGRYTEVVHARFG